MKYIKWTLAAVLCLLMLTVSAFILVNLRDEPLNPEAKAILETPPPVTETGTKAFYYLLGVRASETTHAEEAGRKIWENAPKNIDPLPGAGYFDKLLKNNPWPSIPYPEKTGAMSVQWKERKEMREAFTAKGATAADQYIQLIGYGEMSPLSGTDFMRSGVFSPQIILTGHKWLRVYAGKLVSEKKWQKAEELLAKEAKFARSMQTGFALLTTMISTVILNDNTDFFEAEIKLNPKLTVRKATLAEFRLPPAHSVMKKSLETEMGFFASLMSLFSVRKASQLIADDSSGFTLLSALPGALLPNEATNKYYQFIGEAMTKQCPYEECYESVQWSQPKFPLAWLRNPLGRAMIRIFTVSIEKRYEKLQIRHKAIEDAVVRLSH